LKVSDHGQFTFSRGKKTVFLQKGEVRELSRVGEEFEMK
jgi:hypothetical protein